jgi:5-methyltetrahydrofolate--homocysteine methyltransferase
MNQDELIAEIRRNVVLGRVDEDDEGFDGDMEGQPGVTELVEQALAAKIPPEKILDEGLSAAMTEVGEKYECNEYLIPDMLASAECVGKAMDVLEPLLVDANAEQKGMFVIATVEGDLHDIGKNIVATMLRGGGYQVKDLGTGVKANKIVETAKAAGAKFVGLSALLTTTMVHMKEVIEGLQSAGLRDQVKVLIGGAPTSDDFASDIGADAWCRDAFDAMDKLAKLAS